MKYMTNHKKYRDLEMKIRTFTEDVSYFFLQDVGLSSDPFQGR